MDENKIAITWLEDGGSGYGAIKGLIEDLGKKMGLHGVLWWDGEDDVYFGVSQEPFDDESLKKWAESIVKECFNFPGEDVTAEKIFQESEAIQPGE